MKSKLLPYKRELCLVIVISLLITGFSTINYFAQLLRKPPNHVFIGMTHYFEDFFYYLDQFEQGASGGWLTVNRFTTENLAPTPVYINNILLGKLGGILGFPSFVTYNWSLLILKFGFILLSYYVLWSIFPKSARYRLAAFLIFLFSTSFPLMYFGGRNLQWIEPQRIFRAENLFSSRFGNIPNTYVVNILFLTVWLLMIKVITLSQNVIEFPKKKILILSILTIALFGFLTLDEMMKSGILLLIFILAVVHFRGTIKNRIYRLYTSGFFLILMSVFIAISYLLKKTLDLDAAYRWGLEWDVNEFFRQAGFLYVQNYFIAFGIISVLVLTGSVLFIFRKKTSPVEKIAVETSLICILGYFLPMIFKLPIPGFRMIFAATYLFGSVVALYPLIYIEERLGKKILPGFLIIYLFINILTIYKSVLNMAAPVKEPDYHFTYLPDDIYKGFLFLRVFTPKESIVLANPYSAVDLLVPGISGRRGFTGHFLMTLNSKEKDQIVNAIYNMSLGPKRVKEYLGKNNIKYLLNTIYDSKTDDLKAYYPFLKPVYENKMSTVFEVEK